MEVPAQRDSTLSQTLIDFAETMCLQHKNSEVCLTLWLSFTLHFTCQVQVLKVVNPWIRYRPPGSSELIDGVAINLKALMATLDECNISHPSEKAIRKQLKMHNQAQTHSHHRFLPAYYTATEDVSIINKSDLTTQYGCICIPRDDVPPEFTEYLMKQGMENDVSSWKLNT